MNRAVLVVAFVASCTPPSSASDAGIDVDDAGVPDECDASRPSSHGQVCAQDHCGTVCVEAPRVGEKCAGASTPAGCSFSAPCAFDEPCTNNGDVAVCVAAGCTSDAQCTTGTFCVNASCVACTNGGAHDCGAGFTCALDCNTSSVGCVALAGAGDVCAATCANDERDASPGCQSGLACTGTCRAIQRRAGGFDQCSTCQ